MASPQSTAQSPKRRGSGRRISHARRACTRCQHHHYACNREEQAYVMLDGTPACSRCVKGGYKVRTIDLPLLLSGLHTTTHSASCLMYPTCESRCHALYVIICGTRFNAYIPTRSYKPIRSSFQATRVPNTSWVVARTAQ